jgi:hypothetical protein
MARRPGWSTVTRDGPFRSPPLVLALAATPTSSVPLLELRLCRQRVPDDVSIVSSPAGPSGAGGRYTPGWATAAVEPSSSTNPMSNKL